MRVLVGLAVSLIVALGAYASFATRPVPVFKETVIDARHFGVTGLARAGERLVAVGELGHILLSEDQGATWTNAKITPDRGSALSQVIFLNDKEGIAVGHDSWVLYTQDGGLSWQEAMFDDKLSEPFLGVWGKAEGPIFAYGSFGRFYVSNDHGHSWEAQDTGAEDTHIYAVDGTPGGRLMLVGERGLAMKSINGGQSWERLPEFYRGTMFGLIHLDDDAWIAYGLRGNMFRSTDFGATWEQINTGLSVGLFGHTVLNDGSIIVLGQGGVIIESRDGGRSFSILQDNKGNNLTAAVMLDNGQLLTAGLGGIQVFEGQLSGAKK